MKAFTVLLFLFLSTVSAQAQDSTVTLSSQMFTPNKQQINLTSLNGWIYKPGHNSAWASPGLNTIDWVKRKPAALTVNDADRNGRVDGWFRLKIRLDSSFKELPLGLRSGSWAAIDVYVDGQWLTSFGKTGMRGEPYLENRSFRKPPILIRFVPEQEHLIALHMVDEVSPFRSTALKSAFQNGNTQVLSLVGPQVIDSSVTNATRSTIFSTIWLIVPLLLTVLFGLLSFLNIYEKPLIRLLTLWATVLTLANLTYFSLLFPVSFSVYQINFYVGNALLFGSIPLLVIALLRILNYSSYRRLDWSLIAMMFIAIAWDFSIETGWAVVIATILQALFFLYVLAVSWRNLMGAQWAIVMGALFTIVFFLLYFIDQSAFNHTNFYLISTGMILSLPISLLVYIFLRFKEIVAEVRKNAATVLQMTQEKRDLLATQNERLEQQVIARTTELSQSLSNLEATQVQLIQKEKLASLGELTAGIAHEIQNPLNFVNNFSEVSTELIDELKEGPFQKLPDIEKQYAEEILGDLSSNLQKIHHHGGRASNIVKGMLEHARTESGEKRPTSLNALADEYFKIAYHGLRAKDKEFNCELVTSFDPALGVVEVAPQEIGRVLLNLYNNAFYAVSQRASQHKDADYTPIVEVSTKREVGQVVIEVRDNGIGIPEPVMAKIFQPFFTTKPTGEGTGLGLSLSYDIVSKGHGGTLTVKSQVGQGSEFVIQLPV